MAYFAEKVHANEPGTLLYVLTKHPDEPHTYLWIERYRDQTALRSSPGSSVISSKCSMTLAGSPRRHEN